jgi:hypothetical protein
MDDFRIVDPRRHLWDLGRFSCPWLSARPLPASVAGDVAPIAKSCLLDDYLADAANQNVRLRWPSQGARKYERAIKLAGTRRHPLRKRERIPKYR